MGNNNETVGMEGFLHYVLDEHGLKVECNWMGALSDEQKSFWIFYTTGDVPG